MAQPLPRGQPALHLAPSPTQAQPLGGEGWLLSWVELQRGVTAEVCASQQAQQRTLPAFWQDPSDAINDELGDLFELVDGSRITHGGLWQHTIDEEGAIRN